MCRRIAQIFYYSQGGNVPFNTANKSIGNHARKYLNMIYLIYSHTQNDYELQVDKY